MKKALRTEEPLANSATSGIICDCSGALLVHDTDREDQVAGTDVVDDVQPFDDAAEAGVTTVEMLRRFAGVTDEELRAARVASRMGHRKHAPVVVLARSRGFAFDRVTRTARARRLWDSRPE